MRSQLASVEGVEEVSVDYATKTATVKVKPGTDPEKVVAGLSGRFSGSIKN